MLIATLRCYVLPATGSRSGTHPSITGRIVASGHRRDRNGLGRPGTSCHLSCATCAGYSLGSVAVPTMGVSARLHQRRGMAVGIPRQRAFLARRPSLGALASVVVLARPDWLCCGSLRADDVGGRPSRTRNMGSCGLTTPSTRTCSKAARDAGPHSLGRHQ